MMKKSWVFLFAMLVFLSGMFTPISSVSASSGVAIAVPTRGLHCSKDTTSQPSSNPTSTVQLTPATLLPQGPSVALPSGTLSQGGAAVNLASALPVTLDTLAIFSTNLNGAERVAQVYLPGDYEQNPARRYPVLYALDGQQFPQIDFQQTLNELVSTGQMEPAIVVAVYSTEGDLRREELGAGPNINFLGWGTSSDAFNRFMVEELVPEVNSAYRTLTGPQHTTVMGWSLGGLTSFYLGWQYPDTFGTVGAFSPSFWWRTESPAGQELQARVIPNLVASNSQRPGLRVWLEAGTKELPYSDVDGNGVIDMIQDARDVRDLLLQKGYQAGSDVVYIEVEGGLHELSTWQTVMPDFLKFAFPVS
jgi:enterochelin esterase-like enzyme